MDFAELQRTYELDVYPKRPLTVVRGRNAQVWDDRGREYIDCVCGHGVANLGHGHPHVVAAIREQAERLVTLSNLFFNDERALLLQKLIRIAPPRLTRAFLCNSGTEAVEAALKFARASTGRTGFVAAMNAFHGRTMGALSATFRPEYREPFEPLVPGFSFVPFDDFAALERKVTDATAAVILEPVQGESGVRVGSPEYFQRVRKLCDDRGVLLIVDEAQTGFCRTGAMFACERLGIVPDLLCLAKAIAGGLPMGAVVCCDAIRVPVGAHGSTFGGNPLCCAAASAAIDVMVEEDLAGQARDKGDALVGMLRRAGLSRVREIRHLGLMIGLQLNEPASPVVLALVEAGLLTFQGGPTVIRVYPPLTIEPALLEVVVERIAGVLR
jgi:acetylornithine/LysW-gamma-L-lysine aminotransferase